MTKKHGIQNKNLIGTPIPGTGREPDNLFVYVFLFCYALFFTSIAYYTELRAELARIKASEADQMVVQGRADNLERSLQSSQRRAEGIVAGDKSAGKKQPKEVGSTCSFLLFSLESVM